MLPWETPELIRFNLGVLANLKPGEKLTVLKEGEGSGQYTGLGKGRGLRERFKVSSSAIARGNKGETITNRSVYRDNLMAFFEAACTRYSAGDYDKGGDIRKPLAYDQARREVS